MRDRKAIADRIAGKLQQLGDPAFGDMGMYLAPDEWRLVIASLRGQDHEEGARDMRERAKLACNQVGADSNEPSEFGAGMACGAEQCADAIEDLPLSVDLAEAPDA